MENAAVRKNVQMTLQPIKFEAYSLEDLCYSLFVDKELLIREYLIGDILSCELENSSQGMEYSLVYLQNIIIWRNFH